MKFKKKTLLLVVCLLVVLATVGSIFLYRSYHPNIMITTSSVEKSEEYYCEWLRVVTGSSSFIPIASSINDKMTELSIWNNNVVTDLEENYVAPLNITVSGEVKDGKTTFWYEGYATTPEGDTISYREEKTFDYVFDPDSELFQ